MLASMFRILLLLFLHLLFYTYHLSKFGLPEPSRAVTICFRRADAISHSGEIIGARGEIRTHKTLVPQTSDFANLSTRACYLVPPVGIAPTSRALQAHANLSQLKREYLWYRVPESNGSELLCRSSG
jgi:hypothetical protein